MAGIEPTTSSLPRKYSTTELHQQMHGTPPPTRTGNTLLLREPRLPIAPVGHGGNRRDRTADRHRMKVLLYQLSYITKSGSGGGNRTPTNGFGDRRTTIILHRNTGADSQARTGDILLGKQTFYQLNYIRIMLLKF